MADAQIQKVKDELKFVRQAFGDLLKTLPSFEIANEQVLPYGFTRNTRAVSWIAEKVVTQNLHLNREKHGLTEVDYEFQNTCLHDCQLTAEGKCYHVNVKIHDITVGEAPSDIAAIKKLEKQYLADGTYSLLYCVIGVCLAERKVSFDANYLKVFSPQFLPDDFKVNLANFKVQACYEHAPVYRSREAFLKLLAANLTKAKRKKAAKERDKKK